MNSSNSSQTPLLSSLLIFALRLFLPPLLQFFLSAPCLFLQALVFFLLCFLIRRCFLLVPGFLLISLRCIFTMLHFFPTALWFQLKILATLDMLMLLLILFLVL